MKKTFFILLASVLVFACSTPKTVIQSKKVLKGDWSLDNITYDQAGTFNVTVFNDTSKECLEGSNWSFIPNNNSGVYSIENSDCPTGDRNFIFAIQEVDQNTGLYDFLLKPTTRAGKPDKDSSIGYRLRLAQLSDTNMKWEQTVQLDGKPFKINMNFSKIQE